MRASLAGTLATMGAGTPYAIAAKFAYPDRPVIALVGDGAFQMNGMAELVTVKRYIKELTAKNPTLVFCVFNNQDLNQVTWEQRAESGDPKFMGSQWIPDVPYAEFATLLGFEGIKVDDPAAMGAAWDRALAADRPVVLEVVVDPEIPPIPPHIKKELGRKSATAMLKGDPEEAGVITKGAKQKLHEFTESVKDAIPGRNE
jgi:pyruvate dehydrogenase (quinone)